MNKTKGEESTQSTQAEKLIVLFLNCAIQSLRSTLYGRIDA